MPNNPDACAFPFQPMKHGERAPSPGLTRREYYEIHAMQAIIMVSLTWNSGGVGSLGSFGGPSNAEIKTKAKEMTAEMLAE